MCNACWMNILALLSMDIPASGAPNAGAVFLNVDLGANEARNLLSGGRIAQRCTGSNHLRRADSER
jgi:hypothetical protein